MPPFNWSAIPERLTFRWSNTVKGQPSACLSLASKTDFAAFGHDYIRLLFGLSITLNTSNSAKTWPKNMGLRCSASIWIMCKLNYIQPMGLQFKWWCQEIKDSHTLPSTQMTNVTSTGHTHMPPHTKHTSCKYTTYYIQPSVTSRGYTQSPQVT